MAEPEFIFYSAQDGNCLRMALFTETEADPEYLEAELKDCQCDGSLGWTVWNDDVNDEEIELVAGDWLILFRDRYIRATNEGM